MKVLATADLHLTDRPADKYRWRLFRLLEKEASEMDAIVLAGDITDSKDKHSSWLTNRIVEWIRELAKYCPVIIIRGNHDYIEEAEPFFRFMNGESNITFVTKPLQRTIAGSKFLFLPNTRNYAEAWKGLAFDKFDYIFCHQTFDGCVTENGTRLEGIPPSVFGNTKARVFSGDIHKPQRVSRGSFIHKTEIKSYIEYIGAPYRIRFGDDFTPRLLMIGTTPKGEHQQQNLHLETMMKYLVEIEVTATENASHALYEFKSAIRSLDMIQGDQVKLRVKLDRMQFPGWADMKRVLEKWAAQEGLVLTGPELIAKDQAQAVPGSSRGLSQAHSPAKALEAYGERQKLSKAMLAWGKSYLDGPA